MADRQRVPASPGAAKYVSRNSRGRFCSVACVLAVAFMAAGCSDAQKRRWVYRSPEWNFSTALESDDADRRRDAVTRIAESSYVDSDEAFAVLDTVARTDTVTQIRCIAIRAFARYDDARPVATLLTILGAEKTGRDALPADAHVRWEIAATLRTLAGKDVLKPPQHAMVRDVLIKLLESDPSRNVRIEAIKGLARFKDRQVLLPLIRALRSDDFALADQAERSLIALTGTTHYYDADAWEKWVAATADPFERAGRMPDIKTPRGPTWWDKQRRAFRRAIRLNTD